MERVILMAILLASCEARTSGPEPPPKEAPVPAAPPPKPLPPLRGSSALPMLPTGAQAPVGYQEATALWRTATTAYARGDAVGAADAFLRTADALGSGGPEPIARTLTAGRCIAYEKATRCLAAAGRYSEAKDKLSRAAGKDPACRHSVADALGRLHSEHLEAGFAPQWRPF